MGIKRLIPLIFISLFIFTLAFAEGEKAKQPATPTTTETITPAIVETVVIDLSRIDTFTIDTSRFDTVYVPVLDPGASKEIAQLKSEFYDRELARFEREMNGGKWRINLFQWFLGALVAIASIFAIFLTGRTRNEVREDMKELRERADREIEAVKAGILQTAKSMEDIESKVKDKADDISKSLEAMILPNLKEVVDQPEKPKTKSKVDLDSRFKEIVDLIDNDNAVVAVDKFNDFKEMIDAGEAQVSDVPKKVLRDIGFAYMKLGDIKSAIRQFKVYLKSYPSNEKVLMGLALCYEQIDNSKKALKQYDLVLLNNPENTEALYNKAELVMSDAEENKDQKKLKIAITLFNKVIENGTSESKVFVNSSYTLIKLYDMTKEKDHLDQSVKILDMGAELFPNEPAIFLNFATVYSKLYKLEKKLEYLDIEISYYRQAIKIDYNDVRGHTNLSSSLIEKWWVEKNDNLLYESIEEAAHGLSDLEEKSGAHYNLACAFALLNNEEKMFDHLSRAIKGDSEYRVLAPKDEDFKNYWDDKKFQEFTKEDDDEKPEADKDIDNDKDKEDDDTEKS